MLQIQITGSLEKAISAAVASGEFDSPEAFLKAAIKSYQVETLNAALEEGYRDLENGNVLRITNINEFFESLNREN